MTTFQPVHQSLNGAHLQSAHCMPVKTFSEQFDRMLFNVNENVRLWESWKYRNEEMQSIVNETKKMCELALIKVRPCEQCPEFESRIKQLQDLILELVKAIPKDHKYYDVLFRKVTKMNLRIEPEILEVNKNKGDDDVCMVMGSPEAYPEVRNPEVSPVVKQSRNNKRRLKNISSRKKNKLDDGDAFTNGDLDFQEFDVARYESKSRMETPDIISVRDFVLPLDDIKELDHTIAEEPSLNGIVDMIEPTQKATNLRSETRLRRALTFNQNEVNLNDATVERISEEPSKDTKDSAEKTKSSSPLNVVITNNNSNRTCGNGIRSPEKYRKTPVDDFEKMKQKTKWSLTRSREPTTAKLKQTLLSTAVPEKKTDISTLEKFNGGLIRTEVKKSDASSPAKNTLDNKENSIRPTFDSAITSTANDAVMKTPVKVDSKFPKYPVSGNIVENSFEVIPKTSPNYKYKRDAVRKKSERRKLPGQDCDMCAKYYGKQVDVIGETQVKKMMDKCSRHRDKFSIKSNTPPGFWNPVFDTDDDEPVK